MKTVSVIVTTHNRKNALQRAIESVIFQSYKDIELIIVNDNSTDGTLLYLNQLQLEFSIKVINIIEADSQGGNYARNVGINASTGEFIAFLDDDDYWHKDKIEEQMNGINLEENIGVIYCGFKKITNEKFVTYNLPNPSFCGNVSKMVYTGIFTTTSCILVERRLLFESGLFDEELSHWQETELLMRLAKLSKVCFINKILVTITANLETKNRLSNQIEKWKSSVDYIYKKHEKDYNSLTDYEKRNAYVTFLLDYATRCARVGDKKLHKKNIKKAWEITKQPKYFIRYIFNLDDFQIERVKCFLFCRLKI